MHSFSKNKKLEEMNIRFYFYCFSIRKTFSCTAPSPPSPRRKWVKDSRSDVKLHNHSTHSDKPPKRTN